MPGRYIVGIDEVGRGALAGPIVVAAVAMPQGLRLRNRKTGKLRDSKKLTAPARERWVAYLNAHPLVSYAVARVYPRRIEKMNIARAANLAALRAFLRLSRAHHPIHATCRVVLDGGLFVGNKPGLVPYARTVVKGDEKFAAVKIASILAKVFRDRLMARLAKRYPLYGFEIHKGYATQSHRRAVRRHGPSPAHRLTFLRFS